jgi:cadmium resistance protein CadD (predicted permease)
MFDSYYIHHTIYLRSSCRASFSLCIRSHIIASLFSFDHLIPLRKGIVELLDYIRRIMTKILRGFPTKKIQFPLLTVAAVTFSGGEEIGICTAIFATNKDVSAITTIISVVMVSIALWCFLANYLVKHSFIADTLRRIGSRVLPFVLIGLGLFILVEALLMV